MFCKSEKNDYKKLLIVSEIRGQDGTGWIHHKKEEGIYVVHRSHKKASKMNYIPTTEPGDLIVGQNRLAIFGLDFNNQQPLTTAETALVHNGNLYDFERVFKEEGLKREYQVDSELILRLWEKYHDIEVIYEKVKGDFACILVDKTKKTVCGFTRDKPLCSYRDETGLYWFSTPRIGKKVFGDVKIDEWPSGTIRYELFA